MKNNNRSALFFQHIDDFIIPTQGPFFKKKPGRHWKMAVERTCGIGIFQ